MSEQYHIENISNNPLLEKELKQEVLSKKLRFVMSINGQNVETNVDYMIEPERIIGTCSECNKDNRVLFREKVSDNPKISINDAEYTEIAQEKIRALVEGVENEMLCCEDCFTEEFMKKRPEMYIQAMDIVSKKLGITIDLDGLKEAVLGRKIE